MKKRYDVVVVGAGPAGSIAARECARRGLTTLVVDRRQEIGAPVRCGEGLGEVWMKKAGLKYDPTWCLHESHGAVVYDPHGRPIRIHTKNKGYVIERKMFEKTLAADAIRAGAEYHIKARVYGLIKEDGVVQGVRVEDEDGKHDIHCKLVLGCDGVDSKVGKYAGINTVNQLTEVDSGYEYEMAGVAIKEPDMIHLYVGTKIAPRGYVWIFPKGRDVANVGIGIAGNQKETAKHYLDKFIESHPEIFKDAGVYEKKGGCVPVGAPLERPYTDGVMLVGDAAHMVNAIHGGGMGTAMEAAIIAAKCAKKAVDAGDVSGDFLKQYYDEWRKQRGEQLSRVLKVRRFFEKLSDADMEKLYDFFVDHQQQLLEFSDGSKLSMFVKLFAKSPKIALIAASTLR
jgi:digeranylgeranylglycerophospholipid reductase